MKQVALFRLLVHPLVFRVLQKQLIREQLLRLPQQQLRLPMLSGAHQIKIWLLFQAVRLLLPVTIMAVA